MVLRRRGLFNSVRLLMRYGTLARLDVAQSRVSWRRKAAFAIFSLLSRRDSRKIVRRRRCLVLVLYSHALFDSCPRFWTQSNNDSLWRTADLTALCFYVLSSGVKGDMRVFGPAFAPRRVLDDFPRPRSRPTHCSTRLVPSHYWEIAGRIFRSESPPRHKAI